MKVMVKAFDSLSGWKKKKKKEKRKKWKHSCVSEVKLTT